MQEIRSQKLVMSGYVSEKCYSGCDLITDLCTISKSSKDFLEARFIKNEVLAYYKDIVKRFIVPSDLWKSKQQIILRVSKKL